MEQCAECFERWYAPINYKTQQGVAHHCHRCKKGLSEISKKTNQCMHHVTKFGKANGMFSGRHPPCVRNLTQIEELLVSPIITCMPVYTVKGGSKGVSGNCINFVQNTSEITNVLLRLPAGLDTTIIHAAGYEVNNKSFKVN